MRLSKFQAYVTGTAFILILSKQQINVLSALFALEKGKYVVAPDHFQTFRALDAKGLCEKVDGLWRLTREGKMLIPIIKEAGLLNEDYITTKMPLARRTK